MSRDDRGIWTGPKGEPVCWYCFTPLGSNERKFHARCVPTPKEESPVSKTLVFKMKTVPVADLWVHDLLHVGPEEWVEITEVFREVEIMRDGDTRTPTTAGIGVRVSGGKVYTYPLRRMAGGPATTLVTVEVLRGDWGSKEEA